MWTIAPLAPDLSCERATMNEHDPEVTVKRVGGDLHCVVPVMDGAGAAGFRKGTACAGHVRRPYPCAGFGAQVVVATLCTAAC